MVAVLYGFVVVVDPWDALPLRLKLPRVPISSNARFSFPALARSPHFDAAVFGTSTSRLLRPAVLDPLFGAHFVNLSMNSATAWEQTQLLGVFLRSHPRPRAVLIGLDAAWCGPTAEHLTERAFPAWMYAKGPAWAGYREMLTPYAVQEAANQFATMLGWKRRIYGLDGYTRFVPPESAYDPVRVDAAFARWGVADSTPARIDDPVPLPALELLRPALDALAGTRIVLFFPPISVEQQGLPGTQLAARWAACKAATVRIAAGRAEVLDFMIPSAITSSRTNYWDPLHFREPVATRLATLLARPEPDLVRQLAP